MKNIWQLWLKNAWQLAKWKCSAVVFRDPLAKTKNIPKCRHFQRAFQFRVRMMGKYHFNNGNNQK